MFVKSFLFIGIISLLIIGCGSTQTSLKDKPSVASEFSPPGTQTSLKDRPRVVDPVCAYYADMGCVNVIADDSTSRSVYNGSAFYFCSEECKNDFDKHPEKFIKVVQKAPKGFLDPVCKMPIGTMDYTPYCVDNGNKVFFCSDHCRSKYLASPERYRGR